LSCMIPFKESKRFDSIQRNHQIFARGRISEAWDVHEQTAKKRKGKPETHQKENGKQPALEHFPLVCRAIPEKEVSFGIFPLCTRPASFPSALPAPKARRIIFPPGLRPRPASHPQFCSRPPGPASRYPASKPDPPHLRWPEPLPLRPATPSSWLRCE